jgi:hypothetical protein
MQASIYSPFTFKPKLPVTVVEKDGRRVASFVGKIRKIIQTPEYDVTCVWRGASEIVKILVFTSTLKISLSDITPSTDFCACISWKEGGQVIRYKLWNNVGEILYVPLYAGQRVAATFNLEIWNVADVESFSFQFISRTSELIVPTDWCDTSRESIFPVTPTECTDNIFDLTEINPSLREYWEVIGCGVTVLVQMAPVASIKLQADDGTWHDFFLVEKETYEGSGDTFITMAAERTPTTPGTIPYLALNYNDQSYRVRLAAVESDDGTSYAPYVEGPFTGTSPHAILMTADNASNYALFVYETDEGDMTLAVDQTPIV